VPTPRRCQGCGATLGEPEPGGSVVTCRFCGLAHDVDAPAFEAQGPVVVPIGRQSGGRAGRRLGLILAGIFVFVAVVTLVPMWLAFRIGRDVVDRTTPRIPSRVDRPVLAPADLAIVPTGQGWKRIDVPPPPGGFDGFDPVAGIAWATTIGNAWAADAALTRIDVGRVAATGAIDLSGEHASGYRLTSPARQAQRRNDTDTGTRSLVGTELLLQCKAGTVQALVTDGGDGAPPAAPVSLGLEQILAGARKSRDFVERPFYTGYMIHLPREGWVWYLSTPSGDGLPRVRARDGRVYPYR
jgi:hypothetical protein